MSKIVYITTEALRQLLNEDYGMKLPEDTKFVLTSESDKEREQNYVADLENQLTQKNKIIENLRIDLKDWQDLEEKLGTKYDKVVEQLAEKDEEIHKLTKQIFDDEIELTEKMQDFEKRCQEYYKSNEYKIDFAIAELEKVKEFCEGIGLNMVYVTGENPANIHMIIGNIDNQIKQLKEGKWR